jgi:hypothetical protein
VGLVYLFVGIPVPLYSSYSSTSAFFNPPFGTGGNIQTFTLKNFLQTLKTLFYAALVAFALFAFYIFLGKDDSTYTNNYVESIDTLSIDFPQAADIYWDYKSNKVAFDKKNKEKLMEFEGQISKISNEWGCAKVTLSATDNPYEEIICNNCPGDVDGWSKEVEKVRVGQTVKINGVYSANISSGSTMTFYKCHILE